MTDHPNATDWKNRCERAEAECAELRKDNSRLKSKLGDAVDVILELCRVLKIELTSSQHGAG